MNTRTPATKSLRNRLLLGACFLVVPGVAAAQDTTIPAGTTRSTNLNLDANDTLTVQTGGAIEVAGNQAVTVNGVTSGAGVVITNDGTISAATTGTSGRGITTSGTFADRTISITNTGAIRGTNDGIQLTDTNTEANGTIRIVNSGSITNTGVGQTSGAQGVQVTVASATLNLENRAGGTISGSQGLQVTTQATVVNAGTITGTGAVSGNGDAIRSDGVLNLTNEAAGRIVGVTGVTAAGITNTIINRGTISGSDAGLQQREGIRINTGIANQTNIITLASGSTTTAGTGAGASGNAVALRGSPLAGTLTTLNIETGAIINGNILGLGGANSLEILNLSGSGSQVLNPISNFDELNVLGGTWGIVSDLNGRNGATIAAGATLRYDDDATGLDGGEVSGTIVNNGALIGNRTGTVNGDGPISGTGTLQLVNTGTLVLSGANTYSGATTIANGRLRTAQQANSFSAASVVSVTDDGILDLNDTTEDAGGVATPVGRDQVIANLSGDGRVRTGQLNGATLTFGSDGAATTFAGRAEQLGGFTKVGAGTLTLTGASTATGLLNVTGGGLVLPGSWAGAATIATSITGGGTIGGVLTIADGASVAPGNGGIGTLTTGGLVLSGGSVLDFEFGAPGAASDLIQVDGDLTLDGTLNIADVGGFGEGVYRLINYSGALTDNGLDIGTVPAGASSALVSIQTAVATQINLVYGAPVPTAIQFWDGADLTGNGTVDGGTGSWTNSRPNWTSANGTGNTAWTGNFAVFQGAAGTVTVNDAIAFTGMQFVTDGYIVAGGTGALNATAALTNIRVDPGNSATIAANIGGVGGLLKNDTGTLILSGANSYAGDTTILGGTVRVLGGSAIPVTSAVDLSADATLDIAADQAIGGLSGVGTVLLSGGTLTTGGLGTDARFDGTITGAGGFAKAGVGAVTLAGFNTFTGATSVTGGTLTLDGAGTIGSGDLNVDTGATLALNGRATSVGALSGGGAIQLGTDGALVVNSGVSTTFSGTIAGPTATFTKAGAGTLTLTGSGNDVGTLAVFDGRLIAATAGAIGAGTQILAQAGVLELGATQTVAALSGTGDIALGANRLVLVGDASTSYSGTIDGSGGLTKAGAGTFVFAGANTYTGVTEVAAGTLALDGSVAGAVSVAGGATLSGNGSAAGVVTVGDGTLSPGGAAAGVFTSGGLVLAGGSILDFGLGAPGTGDRMQVNGDLVLDGTLNVSDIGGFGQGVYRLIDYTGTLTDNGLIVGAVPAGTTPGRAQVQTSVGAQVNLVVAESLPEIQFWDGPNTVSNGVIDGGTGSWTNTRRAWTNAAGTGNSEWGGRFAVFQGAAGTVSVDDAIAFSGMQFVTSGYTIAAGTGALNAVEAQTNIRVDPGATATIGASIGGVGGLNKLDTGILVLTGTNSYAGETIVAGGTLRAGATGALPGGTAVSVASGATLDIAAAQVIGSLAGDGSVTLSGGGLTTGGVGTDTRFAGVISGAGALTKTGVGTFTLAGANSHSGGTNVDAGTLRLDGGALGTGALGVADGAVVDLNGGSTSVGGLNGAGSVLLGSGTLTVAGPGSFAGIVSGTGGLTKAGAGNLSLTGANTYIGTTNVNAGTLTLASGALPVAATVAIASGGTLALGAATTIATLNGAGAVALGANTLSVGAGSFSGAIGGTGGVSKTGAGTLTLTGANGYTGATAVNGGVLALGSGGSIAASSGVTLASGGRLDIAGGGAQSVRGLNGVAGTSVVLGANRLLVDNATANSFAGVLSGTGGLTKTGAGTLTLGAANTHTGGTTVAGGVLTAGVAQAFGPGALVVQAPGSANLAGFAQSVASLAGDGGITLGAATLTVNGTTTASYAGVLSGTGGLTKAGTGTQTLSGANTYTGATGVTAGTLLVNGSVGGAVTVGTGGRLGGTGRVGALTVQGILAPGTAMGTLSTTGTASFATTSTLQVDVAPDGTSDLLAATGAVTIAGGNVRVLTGGATAFRNLSTYTIITAASITGSFTAASSDLAFLTPSLAYTPTSVQLRLLRNDVNFAAVAQTDNQRAVGTALAAQTSGALFDSIVNLNAADARGAFDQLSGELHAATASIARREGHLTGRAMLDRFDTAAGDGKQLWIEGGLGRTEVDARTGFADIDANRQSVAGGIELAGGGTRGGLAYRYTKNDIDVGSGEANLKTNSIFAYFGHDFGSLRFAATGGIGWTKIGTDRQVAFTGLTDRLTAREDGMSFVFAGELAYLANLGAFRVGPYAGISYADTVLDGVQETGGAAALVVERESDTTGAAGYGLRGTGMLGGLKLTADIGGRSYLDDESRSRTFRFAGLNEMFDVSGTRLDKTTASGRLDASYTTGPIVIGLGLRGEAGRDTKSYGGRVSAAYRF